ncbi:hypothetical protein HDU76_013201 [Blyttiomyces sp. JEL0837]|nr:hypothetical protein HDU76_013201 [Blyttiomyces sp. JEL0837]
MEKQPSNGVGPGGAGCEFNHDPAAQNKPTSTSTSPDMKTRLRVDSPVFTPSKSITSESVSIPPFVPMMQGSGQVRYDGYDNRGMLEGQPPPDGFHYYNSGPHGADNTGQYINHHDGMGGVGMNVGNAITVGDAVAGNMSQPYFGNQPPMDPFYFQNMAQMHQPINFARQPVNSHVDILISQPFQF